MSNKIYRDRIINKISYAVTEANNAIELDHSGLIGRVRELSTSCIFEPLLLSGFEIGTGKICNREGGLSNETDLVVYDNSILPPVLYSKRDGVFPIEACFYAIEVKSKATASEIQDAITKSKEILKLDYDKQEYPNGPKNISPVVLTFFAFGSDLTETGISELERYAKYDPDWLTDPILKAICVVGKGYWYHRSNEKCWAFNPPTPFYDEVIDFVSGIVNTLANARIQVRRALLGQYLIASERGSRRIIE